MLCLTMNYRPVFFELAVLLSWTHSVVQCTSLLPLKYRACKALFIARSAGFCCNLSLCTRDRTCVHQSFSERGFRLCSSCYVFQFCHLASIKLILRAMLLYARKLLAVAAFPLLFWTVCGPLRYPIERSRYTWKIDYGWPVMLRTRCIICKCYWYPIPIGFIRRRFV